MRHRAKLVALRSGLKAQVHATLAKAGLSCLPRRMCSGGPGWRGCAARRWSWSTASASTRCCELIDAYDGEIELFRTMIANRFTGHRGYRAIQQISGIGPTFAAVFVAEIGDVARFSRPEKLCCWAGLTPRHRESDTTVHRGPITKMGCGGRSRGLCFPGWCRARGGCRAGCGWIDIHRAQLTFDYVDVDSGEVFRGRIAPADRERLRRWLQRFAGRSGVAFALEGCTGWRYVAEELLRAGITAHVAEPAETAARRGPKRRAKTDRSDAQLLRDLLLEGRIPESWIPPQPVLEARALVRLYKDLLDERTGWLQRVHASLFHAGAPELDVKTMSTTGRQRIATVELSPAVRTAVDVAMRQVDRLTEDMTRVREQINTIGRRQPACRALQAAHYGVGPLTSVVIWAEMGDTRRFRSSDDAVRHAGLDVTVYSSDGRRSAGHLARQGPPMLRWALYEAAVYAGRPSSPDHAYFQRVKAGLGGQLALLSMARKLARRCHHTLRNLDDQVLAPAAQPPPPESPDPGARSPPTPPMNPQPAPSNPFAAGPAPDSRPRMSGRTRRDTRIAILSPATAQEPSTQISRGARRTPGNRGHRPTPTGAIMSYR